MGIDRLGMMMVYTEGNAGSLKRQESHSRSTKVFSLGLGRLTFFIFPSGKKVRKNTSRLGNERPLWARVFNP